MKGDGDPDDKNLPFIVLLVTFIICLAPVIIVFVALYNVFNSLDESKCNDASKTLIQASVIIMSLNICLA